MPILMAMLDVVLEEKTAMEAFKGFVLSQSGLAPYFNFMRTIKTEGWEGIKDIIKNRIKAQLMSFVPGSQHISVIKSWLDGNFTLSELLDRKKGELIQRSLRQVFGHPAVSAVNRYRSVMASREKRLQILTKRLARLTSLYQSLDYQKDGLVKNFRIYDFPRQGIDHGYADISPNNSVFTANLQKEVLGKHYRRYAKALRACIFMVKTQKAENYAENVARSKVEIGYRRESTLTRLNNKILKLGAVCPLANGFIPARYPPWELIDNNKYKIYKKELDDFYDLCLIWLNFNNLEALANIWGEEEELGVPSGGTAGSPSTADASIGKGIGKGLPKDVYVWYAMKSTAISYAMFIPEVEDEINGQYTTFGRLVVIFIKTPNKAYTYYGESIMKWYSMLQNAIPNKPGYGAWSIMGYNKSKPNLTKTGMAMKRMMKMENLKLNRPKIKRIKKHKTIRSY